MSLGTTTLKKMRIIEIEAGKTRSRISLLCFVIALGTGVSASSGADVVLPLTSVTPGATNLAVTQSSISETICKSGWTATVRPSSAYTDKLKKSQLAGAYSFYGDRVLGHFEEDHLISLEIGGSPTSPLNLWPEPYDGPTGARVKDKIENKLNSLVCSGKLSLRAAQDAIAKNWYSAYIFYYLRQSTTTTSTVEPTPTTSPTTEGATAAGTAAPTTAPTTAPSASEGAAPSASATTSATPTTAAVAKSFVSPGAFCATEGATGVSSKGVSYTCKTSATDTRLRWRQ